MLTRFVISYARNFLLNDTPPNWEDLLRFRILENNQHYTIQITDILKIFQSSVKKIICSQLCYFGLLAIWIVKGGKKRFG